jgi:alkylation response protein AidB-like acyl-CoA dehydrogenase
LDLSPTVEEVRLRDRVREAVDTHAPLTGVGAYQDRVPGFSADLWHWLDGEVMLAESLQGAGAGEAIQVVYHELGRGLAATPHLSSRLLVGGLLAAARPAGAEAPAGWVAPALWEVGRGDPLSFEATSLVDGRLSGRKREVPFATSADRFLVAAGGTDGPVLCLVDGTAAGVTMSAARGLAMDDQSVVAFDGVEVDPVDQVDTDAARLVAGMARANLAVLAFSAGAAERCLEITVGYVSERSAFGRRIGSFQALQHDIVDAFVLSRASSAQARRVAWLFDQGATDASLQIALARSTVGEAFRIAALTCLHAHGGIGFAETSLMPSFFRAAKQSQMALGGKRLWEDVAAREMGLRG